MTYGYLTVDAPLSFSPPDARVAPVLFNPSKRQFRLVANPARSELQTLVEMHARFRMEAHWDFLMRVGTSPESATQTLRAFVVHSAPRMFCGKR
jgi:hypothetical protein